MNMNRDLPMPDEDALAYLNDILKQEPKPHNLSVKAEQTALRKKGSTYHNFIDSYAYYAAKAAKAWYDQTGRFDRVSLGMCIRAANIGLLLASYKFVKQNVHHLPHFINFAEPYIQDELERLVAESANKLKNN